MKIRNDQFKNTSDFEGRQGSATLNMDRISLFMDNMISNYNFPELAVLREWVSNAHDAHVAAGVRTPVKVTLPSQLNPTLVVQDFGAGMSSEFVEKVYLDFGSSTKWDSNAEIGGFGQGGKSALAIAPQYTMTTIHEGLKSIYIFERSPKGGVDFKNPIFEVPTDEPSGVLVQVAVDRIEEFNAVNINRVLGGWSNNDIQLSTGKQFFSIPDNSTLTEFTMDMTDYSKKGQPGFETDVRHEKGYVLDGAFDTSNGSKKLSNELSLSWSEHVVLVGPVLYVFQPDLHSNRVLRDYMVASVGIGDVSFPSSREVIEASRANRTFVGKTFEKIVDEADKILQKKADAVSDYKSALELYRSPLAENRRDIKITYKGENIPTRFTPKKGDSLFEYQQIGNWRGTTGYKFSEKSFDAGSKFSLNIRTLVVKDDDSSVQSIRNNVRLRHTKLGDKPSNLGGYFLIATDPTDWEKAAAKTILKSSEIAAEAKEYRREQRELAAAAVASGQPLPTTAPIRKTRRDRVGEYTATWLNFSETSEGVVTVTQESSDLMDFYTNHFDPKKTLVLSRTRTRSDYYDQSDFMPHFMSLSVHPKDTQFLTVNTSAKEETLRLVLGDEVVVTGLEKWMRAEFSKLVRFKGRSPREIVRDLPLEIDGSLQSLIKDLGKDSLHPKYIEMIEASEELNRAKKLISGYYYSHATSLVRSLLSDFSNIDSTSKLRPEFFFLKSFSYYRSSPFTATEKSIIRQTMNQMVEQWLDNLALEEAEAEEAAERAAATAESKPEMAAAMSN